MNRLSSVISFALLAAGIAGIIYPAFIEGPPGHPAPGISQALISLFTEWPRDLRHVMGLICVAVVTASLYVLITTIVYGKIPITAVRTTITVALNTDRSRAVISREQVLRANQPNVSAYFTEVTKSEPQGSVPKGEIFMNAFCHGCTLTSSFECIGHDHTGFEIIHSFGRDMPYTWYLPLIPNFMLTGPVAQMLPPIRNGLVIRTQTAVYLNELNSPHPALSFAALSYPQRNISVQIDFGGNMPHDLIVRRIKSNGVVAIQPEIDQARSTVKIYADRLQDETLRISWKGDGTGHRHTDTLPT